jgi:hypothetical protein
MESLFKIEEENTYCGFAIQSPQLIYGTVLPVEESARNQTVLQLTYCVS